MFLPRRYKCASEGFRAILGPFLRKTEGVCSSDSQRLRKDTIMFTRKSISGQ